ncbi:hypothetical protein Rs2_16476 [Raphanus sativus]|nr:hypothetical protein Rs2_16476 [Raphanus sativus]
MFTVKAEIISIRAVVSTTFTSRESSPSSSAHKSEGEILTKSNLINPCLFEFRPLLLNGGSVIATDEVSVEEETSMLLSIGSISEQQPQVKREICVTLIKMLLLELEKPSNLKYYEP